MAEPRGLLPPNATPLEQALDLAAARLGEVPVPIAAMWSPARCPQAALPLLAQALAVEEWGADWPVEIKRAVIAGAVEVHRLKGTPAAVKRLLDGIGAVYDYAEPQALHCSVAIHNSAALVLADAASLRAAIDRVKRASAHCTLTLNAGLRGSAALAAGAAARTVVELGCAPTDSA